MTTGGASRMAGAADAISSRRPTIVCCASVVPQRITATGVSAGRPASSSARVMAGRLRAPMRMTRVSTAVARRAQSTEVSALPSTSCPVTTANDEAVPRWVTGMPA